VRLLFAQAAALAALTAYLIVLDLTDADDLGVAISLTVLAALGSVAVFFVARALGRRSAPARGPAVVIQLFLIATGGFLVSVGPQWLGVLLMVIGAGVGLLCLLPPTTRALGLH
jgi:hypothetical protein